MGGLSAWWVLPAVLDPHGWCPGLTTWGACVHTGACIGVCAGECLCMCTREHITNVCMPVCEHVHVCLQEATRLPRRPSPRKVPTFREMLSSESLLQRALRGLVSSSASLGLSGSELRGAPSNLQSVPTSRRPRRCSAEPSRGRIWAGAQNGHVAPPGAATPTPSATHGCHRPSTLEEMKSCSLPRSPASSVKSTA